MQETIDVKPLTSLAPWSPTPCLYLLAVSFVVVVVVVVVVAIVLSSSSSLLFRVFLLFSVIFSVTLHFQERGQLSA